VNFTLAADSQAAGAPGALVFLMWDAFQEKVWQLVCVVCACAVASNAHISDVCDVTTRPDNPTQLGRRRARPCRRVVLSGNTCPGKKPRRAHTHGVDRGKTPRAANKRCVTGSLLARVEGLDVTLTPLPLIPSTARPIPSDPQKTPLRHPQRTLRALLTMRCYRHIHATLHNVSH